MITIYGTPIKEIRYSVYPVIEGTLPILLPYRAREGDLLTEDNVIAYIMPQIEKEIRRLMKGEAVKADGREDCLYIQTSVNATFSTK